MNFLRMTPKKRCVFCNKKVGDTPAHIRYKYIENDEPKIGTAFLCKKCAETMNQSTQAEADYDEPV